MDTPLNLLIVEDAQSDFLLLERHLKQQGLAARCHCVTNLEELTAAIDRGGWDVVLSDYRVPALDFQESLARIQARHPHLPVILVSGSLGEERAVDLLKLGVWDFVLKDNLTRLVPAIERGLREAADRRARHAAESALRESRLAALNMMEDAVEARQRTERVMADLQREVSERRQAEAALRQSETEFRAMFEVASIGMAQADPRTGRFLRVNLKLCEITGYSAAELLQLRGPDITHPEDRERDGQAFERVVGGEASSYRMEKRYVRQDGTLAWVNVNMTVIRDADGQPVRTMATIEDITERKRAEAERERLSTAIEQADEVMMITDAAATIQYVNPAFTRVTGYTREEALGQNPRLLNSGKQDTAFYRQLWDTLGAGQTWQGRFVNRRKDGTLYTEEATLSPVRDATGTVVNFVAVKRDITRELDLESQFMQAQKMESVGRLAGGVAHDFNNMLQTIMGSTELVMALTAPDDPRTEDLKEVAKAAQRAAGLTRQLLAFARKQTIAPQVLDLNDTIANMLKMLRRLIGEHIELLWKPGANLGAVKMDPSQVDQVLANLAVNARDAIAGVGKLTIETGQAEFADAYCASHAGFIPGTYVMLAVSDDGCGMDRETLERIFEPFFTTKAPGQGTGLGLATVYGIVKQNGGFISVYSEPRQGTTFKVYLPRYAETAAEAGQEAKAAPLPAGTETVLLVEDDPPLLRFIERSLRDMGYTVVAAEDPSAALRLAGEYKGSIDLMLTDVVMPKMNGRELRDRLGAIRPGIKCLFMSGYTADAIARHGVLDEGVHLLQKPFSRATLAAKIREMLAG